MERISVLCPTRKRVPLLQKMIESAVGTSSQQFLIEFCLYIDCDDTSYVSFLESQTINYQIKYLSGPRLPLTSMINSLLTIASGDYIFGGSDDIIFRTQNWDKLMVNKISEYKDKLLLVYPDDGAITYKKNVATLMMVHRNWINLFGYLLTPMMPNYGAEVWQTAVAKKSGRLCSMPGILVEHMHFRQKKGENDSVYEDRSKRNQIFSPKRLYRKLSEERRRDELLLLRAVDRKSGIFEFKFLLGSMIAHIVIKRNMNVWSNRAIYFQSMNNMTVLKLILSKTKIFSPRDGWN